MQQPLEVSLISRLSTIPWLITSEYLWLRESVTFYEELLLVHTGEKLRRAEIWKMKSKVMEDKQLQVERYE